MVKGDIVYYKGMVIFGFGLRKGKRKKWVGNFFLFKYMFGIFLELLERKDKFLNRGKG